MKGLPPEHAAAKAEAWLRDNGFTSLPIDPVKVAELLEIPVHPLEQTKPGVSGMLHRAGNQFVIMFGTYIKNPGFQRFSIAHEIGHYLLPGHPEHLFPPGVTSHSSQAGFISADVYEQEADYFASGLLMPDTLVKSALRRLGEGLEGIEALKEKMSHLHDGDGDHIRKEDVCPGSNRRQHERSHRLRIPVRIHEGV